MSMVYYIWCLEKDIAKSNHRDKCIFHESELRCSKNEMEKKPDNFIRVQVLQN